MLNKKDIYHRARNFLLLNASFNNNVGIIDGKSIAPLFLHMDNLHCTTVNGPPDLLFSFLEEIMSQINESTPLTMGDGVAGLGILLEYLSQENVIDDDPTELLEDIEPYFIRAIYSGRVQKIDIFQGISGIGFYFLHRLATKNFPKKLQQMNTQACIISCVDQIASLLMERTKETQTDLSIFTGLSGVCLFLNWVNELKIYEPFTSELLKQLIDIIFKELKTAKFSRETIEAHFAVSQCNLIKSYPQSMLKLKQSFLTVMKTEPEIKNEVNELAFTALWLWLIGNDFSIESAKRLSKEFGSLSKEMLKNNLLTQIYGDSIELGSIPIGLRSGICGYSIPLLSLDANDYNWLAIIGVKIAYNKS